MNPELLALIEQIRLAALRSDAQAIQRLTEAYRASYGRLNPLIEALVSDLLNMENPTRIKVERLGSYKALIAEILREATDFSGFLKVELSLAGVSAVNVATRDAERLLAGTLLQRNITPERIRRLTQAFNRVNVEPLVFLADYLNPAGELYSRIDALAPFLADKVSRSILEGVALGRNPRVIAQNITNVYGIGLTDSLRMTRTVQLYSYRRASQAAYEANGVDEWVWWAKLDGATCMSCVAQHGTRHPVTETLNDHHNGRCVMLPIPPILDTVAVGDTGLEWFESQPESVQRQMLGPAKYQAWQEGKIDLVDLSATHEDGVFGEMRVEATLKGLLGDE